MRSTVGWLCFGILVVCVFSVESDVSSSGGYQIIEGHSIGYPGQIFQRVAIPTVGYPSNVPQVQARYVEARNDGYQDSYEYERDEEDGSEETSGEEGNRSEETNSREEYYEENREEHYDPAHAEQQRYEEELDRQEEEDLMEENSEFYSENEPSYSREESEEDEDMERYMYENGRQAYRNINKIQINATAPTSSKNTSNKIKASSPKNPIKDARRKNNKNKANNSKTKKPINLTEETLKNSTKTQEIDESQKQNWQLKVVTNSNTQFVATPIADLILRLSISLAKPIGQANETSTYITVPVRLANNDGGSDKKNTSASDTFKNKVETLLQKISSVAAISRPSNTPISVPIKEEEVSHNQEKDDGEEAGDDGEDQAST
ncbi:probable serine/threonine-protein kinase kinX [Eupeodes corollae]|uniref:probable serine/threonine-protein kinase kinX n=1 Tax=Eupeodes corollae TaxID=290404 RepID=UPI00248FF0B2|nr:probable serine/threonine-protein kinase kinX [Eupeodes corollae]